MAEGVKMGRWCWQEDKVWLRGGGETGGAEEPEEIGLAGFDRGHDDVCCGLVPAPKRYAVEAMANKSVYLGPFGNCFDRGNHG